MRPAHAAGPALLPNAQRPAAAGLSAFVNVPLQLEIFIDERPARLVGAFTRLADGRLSSKRSELAEAGIAAPGGGGPDDDIVLDSIPGLTFRYDEATQTIHFKIPPDLRAAHSYDGAGLRAAETPAQSALGAVLNYNLYTSALRSPNNSGILYQGGSASLDGRIFSQFGTLSQSAIVGSTTFATANVLRLDTAYTYSDPESLRVYKAGDTISSGLPWTRPVRLGGLQVQRNFGLRPDLVTLPLPSVSGSAAVPSTLDVYVNNVKTFTQEVEAGPYRVNNLPLLGGDGTARVVLRDASGHEVQQTLPFFAAARLLQPGLYDYSVEAGLPRLFYGVDSNTYSPNPVVSASLRGGIFDWLTAETHVEGGAGLYNGGLGGVARLFDRAALSAAVSGSHARDGSGLQAYAAFETRLFGVNLNVTSQRTFGAYDDLASVTAALAPRVFGASVSTGGTVDPFSIRTSIRPPRAQDRVSLSIPVPFDRASSFGLSFVNQISSDNLRSRLVTASYSRSLPFNASAFVTAFKDLAGKKEAGVFVGLSVPLGPKIYASSGATVARRNWSVTTEIAKPLDREIGSYSWRVRDSEGKGQNSYQYASAGWRSPYGRLEVGASQQRNATLGTAEFDGALATLGGGLYAANRIDDSFALVDAGAPNVEVLHDNHVIGKTGYDGRILVPELRSYQRNKIEINPLGLPLNAAAGNTQDIIAPADRSGILVDFKVRVDPSAALVEFRDAAGKPLAPGVVGKLSSGERFVVGYDGQAYLSGLKGDNQVEIDLEKGPCRASFAYAAKGDAQVRIGPVACK